MVFRHNATRASKVSSIGFTECQELLPDSEFAQRM
ncbi:hypothetical protein HP15_p187g92 (plasmid) [Marinobacter adhaerens HP15]|uniref:Uncharacterized protein n=1 Tax=Marinobacter adhaerens (strain DSM 23420 / HP15) TaxID=225937 RepID=E4PS54_MARAH|nr:hypothetical protein HP15_p187g92 [Marinobacter adhaerens HP15]